MNGSVSAMKPIFADVPSVLYGDFGDLLDGLLTFGPRGVAGRVIKDQAGDLNRLTQLLGVRLPVVARTEIA